MGERTRYAPGTFSWTDLSSPDPAGSAEFYIGLFGWEPVENQLGDGAVYTMMLIDGHPVAAVSSQPEQQRQAGVPPMWNSYVTVDSADATAGRAAELGATVHAAPFDVMEAGRMAVIQDPQGAFFELWEGGRHLGAGLVNAPGALTWNELATPDIEGSSRFYGDLLGWQVEPLQGVEIPYSVIRTSAGGSNGGIRPAMPAGTPPHWLVYFGCQDIAGALRTVTALGGTALTDVVDMGPGRFAPVRDPQGAIFALYTGQFED